MADRIAEVAIAIGADIAPLVAGLNKGQSAVAKFGQTAEGAASGGMKRFSAAGLLMGGAVAAAAIGMVAMTKRAVENAGALHDLSAKTGVHVSTLQAMSQVANEASVSTEELTGGLRKMQDNIAGLMAGTKAQTEAFGKMGLGVRDLMGLSADEQFAVIAEAIDGIADPTLKTAAAIDAFGKSGANLIPVMTDYRNVVAEVARHQRDLGIAISDTDAAQLDDLGDSFGRLKDSATGAAMQMAVTFGPALMGAVELLAQSMMGLNAAFKDFKDWLDTTEAEAKAAALANQMDELQNSTSMAAKSAQTMADQYQNLADGKISAGLRSNAESLLEAQKALALGAISAEDYREKVNLALQGISSLLATIGRVNQSDMSDAVAAMGDYASEIANALGIAVQLKATTDAISLSGSVSGGGGTLNPDGSVNSPPPPVGIVQPAPITISSFAKPSGGSGGGGGGNSLADDLKALQERLASEAEIELAAFEAAQVTLEDALSKKLLTQEEYQANLEKLQQDHQDRMASIDAGAYGDSAQKIGAYFGVLADTFQSGNERMQKAGRIFGAAEALVNAWRAYTQTLADPTLPFFAKFAAGAAVLSAGLGAVNAIKSGSTSGGRTAPPSAAPTGAAAASSPQSIANITLVGDTFTRDSLEALFRQINDGLKQGRTINLVNQ